VTELWLKRWPSDSSAPGRLVIVETTITASSSQAGSRVRRRDQLIDREPVLMVVAVRANDERRDRQVFGRGLVDVLAGLHDRNLQLVGERTLHVACLMDHCRALRLRVAQQPGPLQLVQRRGAGRRDHQVEERAGVGPGRWR